MSKIKNCIILAAGNSTRFGTKNKLHEKFNNKTLVEHNVNFCIDNDIDNVYITINNISDFKKILSDEFYQQNRDKIKIKMLPQLKDTYGPGAAILPWKNLNQDTLILFGDNYYNGILPKFDLKKHNCYFSYIEKDRDPQNLRLAAIIDKTVIEKPHSFLEGKFFCGYVVLSEEIFSENYLDKIEISGRGEYEITDLINRCETRECIENNLIWSDITYQEDVSKMEGYINSHEG